MAGADHQRIVQPPFVARALVRLASGPALGEVLLGDLQEEYCQAAQHGERRARSWYWRQALASTAPLLRRRVHSSALASAAVLIVLSALGVAMISLWEATVARAFARSLASVFEAPPIVAVRALYILVQMMSVAAAAMVVALATFRTDDGLVANAARRLTLLAVLLLGPPMFASLFTDGGYPLSFQLPWLAAMVTALALGAAFGARGVQKRR